MSYRRRARANSKPQPRPPRKPRAGCPTPHKVTYTRIGAAQVAALARRHGKQLRPYRCKVKGHWHLTSQT